MVGLFAAGWRPSFIGRLERASHDWPSLMAASRIPALAALPLRASSSNAQHESSRDPQRAREAMGSLLRTDSVLRRRLCLLLQPDYVCFGYELRACIDGRELERRR